MHRVILLILFILLADILYGQNKKPVRYVQVDGIVIDESGSSIRYVNIISKMIRRGTETDQNGMFSLISAPGDTILFTSVGYKPGYIIIPGIINGPAYSIDIEMQTDTIYVGSVLVLPWKTYEEFKRAVIEFNPPEEELLKNMEANLAIIERQIYTNLKITPEAGYRYAMQQEAERIITTNQTPVNNLINPFAWAKFIDGLKNGLLKNKKSDKKKKKSNKGDDNSKK
ncbi:MAG: carboxypeptidase-like regulatory domain-containing protein [Bacteroidales bacterium]|nr:carboxypeptidase-like regulatory domain-containing protein [Bacteroidales bacterium]